ncbi:hypothetical protein HMPREF9098_1106 [Kingella denitrificans ATCC 33394]|uniref:Uncharacterized protein n=1 Tax=Kingella denitrificans ATCC 33394 TaxID=888741 RepID=F0EZ22_9NEIS|nr:hypothetical protein HMPREF9098_1106 [Kingella denitrificans ATCC 33394]
MQAAFSLADFRLISIKIKILTINFPFHIEKHPSAPILHSNTGFGSHQQQ